MTSEREQILTGQKTAAASRKDAHIDLALDPATKSIGNNGFDRVRFEHCALPEIELSAIDLSVKFLSKPLAAPMMIGAMTGGTCLLYTSPSPRDGLLSRMPSSA